MFNELLNDYFVVIAIVCFILHIIIGIYLNKVYYLNVGKSTPFAFIPLANLYLIGSLALHDIIGLILVVISVLNINYPITINNEIIVKRILPQSLNDTLLLSVIILSFILLIVIIFKQPKKETYNNDNYRFLTESELMTDPTHLKKQSLTKRDELKRNDDKLFSNDTPKPFPDRNNLPRSMPNQQINNQQMPKPFNSQPFNNQNKLPNNNSFNNRKF